MGDGRPAALKRERAQARGVAGPGLLADGFVCPVQYLGDQLDPDFQPAYEDATTFARPHETSVTPQTRQPGPAGSGWGGSAASPACTPRNFPVTHS